MARRNAVAAAMPVEQPQSPPTFEENVESAIARCTTLSAEDARHFIVRPGQQCHRWPQMRYTRSSPIHLH
jgi:hypothetical protein